MAGSALTASLLIQAEDRTSKVFAEIEARIQKLQGHMAGLAKMGGSEASGSMFRAMNEVGQVNHAMQNMERAFLGVNHSMAQVATEAGRASRGLSDVAKAERDASKAAAQAHREEEKRSHAIAHHGIVNYALGGAAGAVSAHGIAHLVHNTAHAGAELQHERVMAMNAGRSEEELKEFEEAAKKVALARPTASYVESMKTLIETTGAFGSTEHAIEHLDFMMKNSAVLKNASGGKIDESAGEMGQQFAKFFEMRGVAGDAKRFEREGDEMVRAMAFSGGNFNPREMFGFAQQAKAALRGYDLQYLSRVVPSLIGEQGGQRAGTAAMAFYNTIMGKARDAKQAKAWMDTGLLDPKKVEMKKGQAVSWSPGAVKGTDLALSNPVRWFEEVALPAMRKKGIKVDEVNELSKVLAVMYRNQNANQFANENAQLADRTRIHKDAALIDKTASPEEMYERNLREDVEPAMEALKAAFASLGAAVAQPGMATAATTITGIAHGVTALAAAAHDHPKTAMAVGAGVATGAAAGAGYLSYQFATGFGLRAAGTSLEAAAIHLNAAAGKLDVASVAGKAGAAEGAAAGAGRGALLGGLAAAAVPGAIIGGVAIGTVGALGYVHRNDKAMSYGLDQGMFPSPEDEEHPVTAAGKSLVSPYGGLGGIRRQDFGGLDEAKQKAGETKEALDKIGDAKAAPQIDSSSIDAATAKVNALGAALAKVNGQVGGLAAAAGGLGSFGRRPMNTGTSAPGTSPAGRTP